jgi:hypothetical protein
METPEQQNPSAIEKTAFGDAIFHGLASSITLTAVWLTILAHLRGHKLERDAALDEAYLWFCDSSKRLRQVLPSAAAVSDDAPQV